MMTAEVENDCPICQETLHGTFSVGCTVPCGHLFHRRCFETWQIHSTAKRCPCCNSNLLGFIDKIHITLPASNSNPLDDPEIKLTRRKALSNEKARRSAMMRHKDRRRKSDTKTIYIQQRDETEERGGFRAVKEARSVSLSASLQRVPADPVKGAELELAEQKESHNFSLEREIAANGLRSDHDFMFEGVEHLEDQIPDVAEKIMQNIERSLRHSRNLEKQTVESQKTKLGSAGAMVKK